MELRNLGISTRFITCSAQIFFKLDLIEKLFANYKPVQQSFHGLLHNIWYFTWLIFRIEDVGILFESMKTFVGIGGYFDFLSLCCFCQILNY